MLTAPKKLNKKNVKKIFLFIISIIYYNRKTPDGFLFKTISGVFL